MTMVNNCYIYQQSIQMQKDNDHYTHDQPPSYSQPSDKRQELSTLNRSTPLHFTLRINGQYYISYEKNQFWNIIIRSVAWLILNILIIQVVNNLQNAGDTLKTVLAYGLITQNVLYLLICLIDPGTVFQDEEDSHDEERTLCMTCSVYRLRSTKHCIWCNKCAKKYDHHCSVFGKCIAKRNLLLFYAFIIVSGLETPCLIMTIVSHLTNK